MLPSYQDATLLCLYGHQAGRDLYRVGLSDIFHLYMASFHLIKMKYIRYLLCHGFIRGNAPISLLLRQAKEPRWWRIRLERSRRKRKVGCSNPTARLQPFLITKYNYMNFVACYHDTHINIFFFNENEITIRKPSQI